MIDFSTDEKCALFDKIEKMYFERNFGSVTKSDFETFLFSEYIEHCLEHQKPYDDYTLSKTGGITQSRVRTLKERKELKYPYEKFDWKENFASLVRNAKYDEADHYVKIIIEDVNVMNEVRHFIEEKGWYDECSLNKKLLRIPLNCFAEICIGNERIENLFTPDVKADVEKLIDENSPEKDKSSVKNFLTEFSKEGLEGFLMSASKELICGLISLLPFGGIAKTGFEFLAKVIGGV